MSTASRPEFVRAFIALLLDENLLDLILSARQELQRRIRSAAVRWIPRDQIHLTLKFLGHVPVAQLPDVEAVLRPLSEAQSGLSLDLKGFGCFPDSRRPKVIWLGVGGEKPELARFQERIHNATQSFGDHLEERSFHPHLTLARVKEATPSDARQIAGALEQCGQELIAPWPADKLALMESRLTPQGPIYHRAALLSLAGIRSDTGHE
jgi:RNA 2',3'-cyclic 3'-phosphodiesterase